MILTRSAVHGYKRLNYTSTVHCDACGCVCTDDFHELFHNHLDVPCIGSTASFPFHEEPVDDKSRQLCPACYGKLNEFIQDTLCL